jgi:hypothetical protein
MIDQNIIYGDNKGDGEYLFTGLYSADYNLKMSYKSFVPEIKVIINNDKTLELEFPAEFTVDFNCMNSYGGLIEKGEISLDREGKGPDARITSDGKAEVVVPPGVYAFSVTLDDDEIARQNIEIYGNKDIDIVTSQGSFLHSIVTYFGIILAVFSIALIVWKKNVFAGMKLLAIAFIFVALVSPWWVLTGDNGTISTITNTYLVPSKIITLTSSDSVFGGEISSVPSEFSMVLNLIMLLLFVVCIIIIINLVFKFSRFGAIFSIFRLIITFLSLVLFYFTMSEVTKVGVGSFMGSGDLIISLPGISDGFIISCYWGPGIGFYFILIATIISSLVFYKHLIKV